MIYYNLFTSVTHILQISPFMESHNGSTLVSLIVVQSNWVLVYSLRVVSTIFQQQLKSLGSILYTIGILGGMHFDCFLGQGVGWNRCFLLEITEPIIIQDFYEKEMLEIMEKTVPGPRGCVLHTGYPSCTYAYKSIIFPGYAKRKYGVHRAVLMLHHKLNFAPTEIHASHLCHTPKCVNIDHLRFESAEINGQRQTCNTEGYCYFNHDPACIF